MEYKVKIGPEIYTVDVAPPDDSGSSDMILEGETRSVTVECGRPNHLHLQVGGRSANVFVARTSEGTWIWFDGRARLVQDASVVERRKGRGLAETPCEVTPPAPRVGGAGTGGSGSGSGKRRGSGCCVGHENGNDAGSAIFRHGDGCQYAGGRPSEPRRDFGGDRAISGR